MPKHATATRTANKARDFVGAQMLTTTKLRSQPPKSSGQSESSQSPILDATEMIAPPLTARLPYLLDGTLWPSRFKKSNDAD
jgi:hypothetical protein